MFESNLIKVSHIGIYPISQNLKWGLSLSNVWVKSKKSISYRHLSFLSKFGVGFKAQNNTAYLAIWILNLIKEEQRDSEIRIKYLIRNRKIIYMNSQCEYENYIDSSPLAFWLHRWIKCKRLCLLDAK